ncbi:MAG TPA: histidine--tRNA ligase [Acidobacteriaceae bacterium]|nr:histidine--tRNA ligase [Acidobacteriaceae bacterium]
MPQSSSPLKAVRGTRDLLPPETALWARIEQTAREVFARYGFGEIRTPIFEATELFARGVGEETDIVSKEMYTWEDRARAQSEKAQSLTLRPENTAGVVRAYIEHKLGETGALQKLFYIGPQFRRERPQRGRYRQFWQIGCEVLGPPSSGSESPVRDAEVLEMLATLLDELGVKNWQLVLNSVGSSEDRKRYNVALREALAPVKHKMSGDNQRRAETNPLRVLDSKDPADQEIIAALPKIADYLDEDSREHFSAVLSALDACGVPYTVNPRLVRGLDYYTRTTFEFTVPSSADPATGLGTQNALLGGGRYDGLSEMLGGPKAPGIGFAIGEDRLVLTLQAQAESLEPRTSNLEAKLDAYIAPMGIERNAAALALSRELRRAGLSVEVGDGTFRLKKSFEAADRAARHIVILGEDEVASSTATVKTFATGEQVKVERAKLIELLKSWRQRS